MPGAGQGGLLRLSLLFMWVRRGFAKPQLQIVSRLADADNIVAAIFFQIRYSAASGGNRPPIQNLAAPFPRIPAVDIDAVRLPAESGYDFVAAIAIQIDAFDCVRIQQRVVNHFAIPHSPAIPINHDLVPMPRLNRGQKTLSSVVPHRDIACPTLRPRLGAAFGNLRARPLTVPAELI